MSRRRAVIAIGDETLTGLLHLPEGWRVGAVAGDFARLAVLFQVTADDLDEVAEGEVPPEVDGWVEEMRLIDDAGMGWARWGWTPRYEPLALGCAVGQTEQCGGEVAGAIAVRARPRWDSRHAIPSVVLLCERHFTTPPAEWDAVPDPPFPGAPA